MIIKYLLVYVTFINGGSVSNDIKMYNTLGECQRAMKIVEREAESFNRNAHAFLCMRTEVASDEK